ncbi:MAG: CHASE2 domain-containing protein [Coleofasciculaceae cyanobacterium]
MSKLIIIKLGEGSFESGFSVTLQMGEEAKRPNLEIIGKLPASVEIPQYYHSWATSYRQLGLRSRLEASSAQITNVSKLETCDKCAQELRNSLNRWLASESFRPIREKLLERLMPAEPIRIIIQTENTILRRLPWHLWDLCDRYSQAEIALSAPIYDDPEQLNTPHSQVRILAILGNSTGIDTQVDRLLLEKLPNSQINFLVEPQRQKLTEAIWQQGWDILFFAGHSDSQSNFEAGQIYINQTDSLTIDQLRYALKKAVARGLKIAIFNSCDGLGLAQNLADLQIPQIIIMREPVPDQVAQAFLKYFLESFSSGESFYLSVRQAREKLQGWEDQFPCATWLPIIFQNPAIMPPTWQELGSENLREIPTTPTKRNLKHDFVKLISISLIVTSLLIGIRQLGILQPLELQAFDHLLQTRPPEKPDSRLLVIAVTEADIQAQKNEPRRGSLSDRSLTKLLEKLESYQPRAIGLDIYRDFPVSKEYPDLSKRLQTNANLIAVCKPTTESHDQGIAPPPEVPSDNLGFSDVVIDPDGILRRQLLAFTPSPTSRCSAAYALSTQLAFRYLAAQKIFPTYTSEGYLKLNKTIFKRLKTQTGSYQNIDAWGHQILLNYRYHRSPDNFVPQVTLTQVLNNQLNANAVKDKVVLIGVTAPSAKDYFFTPYSASKESNQQMPGVIIQAQMVSQILAAVLDGRMLFWSLPEWGEVIWILFWSLIGAILACRWQLSIRLGILVVALVVLYGLCLVLFLQGCWLPLVPAALALVCTNVSVVYAFKSKTSLLQGQINHGLS